MSGYAMSRPGRPVRAAGGVTVEVTGHASNGHPEGLIERISRDGRSIEVALMLSDGTDARARLDLVDWDWLELRPGDIVRVRPTADADEPPGGPLPFAWRAGFLSAAAALGHYDARDRPRHIAAPTLLTVGSADEVLPPAHTRALATLIPDAEVVVFDGCGHQPFREQPGRFNVPVTEFLAAAGARRAAAVAG
jgi:pimeloyl-ACP methyl ester carboxylesterase